MMLSALRALPQAPAFSEIPLFVSGQHGYNTYRIPAIVRSPNGTLLAFCEGRKNSASDSGDIDIVLKRSTNNGIGWLPMSVVQEEGVSASITIGNPVPVVDEATGYIHLLFCRDNDRVFHTVSTNDGITWSTRTEITSTVKPDPDWGWYATGPGHGIQLKRGAQAGRLVVPSDHTIGPDGSTSGIFGCQVVHSDDHGATWQLGAIQSTTNNLAPNENLAVELVAPAPDGGSYLYFNSRESGSVAGTRAQGWSTNGGTSYAGLLTNNTTFICPVVQGSVLRLRATDEGASENRILFSCPNHASSRVNMSIWSSTNEALAWTKTKAIYSGPSAYSDMVRDSEGYVGLLYEKGTSSPYETITFSRFNEAWLDAPAPPGPPAEAPVPAFWNLEEKTPGQVCSTNPGAIRDIHPAAFTNHLTAQAAFAYVDGPTNFGSGAALHFDGTGGLQLSDAASSNHFDFAATNSFTVEVVFRIPAGSTQVGALVSKDYGTKLPSWWLRVESGRVRFLVADTQIEPNISSTNLVNDGNWHHVAAVRDASIPAAKSLRLYVDGTLNASGSDTTTESQANSQPLSIGRFGVANTRNLTGDIDMVRITPGVLAPSEFLAHYTQFDADNDLIPDSFERTQAGSLGPLGPGDADDDQWTDLLEFALGSDPLAEIFVPQLEVLPEPASVQVNTWQRVLPPWLGLQLESSGDFLGWDAAIGTPILSSLGGDLYLRTQTMPYPSGAPPRLFFRFQLYQVP